VKKDLPLRVIGVDAGGTKTFGVLMDEDATVLQRARAGGSNVRSLGIETAERNLETVLKSLLESEGVQAICVGAAGVGRSADYEQFLALVRRHVPDGLTVELRSDAQIILRAAELARPAVAVIAGTGSLVYGENQEQAARAGGYGAVIGDPGSGYSIGIAALRETAEALDAGTATKGNLTASVMRAMAATTVADLIDRVHRWPPEVGLIASLCKQVGQAAQEGDPVARRIVAEAGAALARLLRFVEPQIRSTAPLPIVLSGGAFDAIPSLAEEMQNQFAAAGPCRFVRLSVDPAVGAGLTALDLIRR